MGYFCLSLKETPEDQLNCALGNLEMFRECLANFGDIRDNYGNKMPDYLLGFVESQIKDSLKYLSEQTPR